MPERNTTAPLRQKLIESARHIKRLGFRVFIAIDQEQAHGYYSDGKNVAYFEQNEFGQGIRRAICNKTPGSFGMHHLLERGPSGILPEKLDRATLEEAFADYPSYFTKEEKEMMPTIKWLSLQEFLEANGDRMNLIEVE